MKKTYTMPRSIAMTFITEGMMAQSVGVSSDEIMTSGDFLSNKRQNGPWNNETSSNPSGPWTNMNE